MSKLIKFSSLRNICFYADLVSVNINRKILFISSEEELLKFSLKRILNISFLPVILFKVSDEKLIKLFGNDNLILCVSSHNSNHSALSKLNYSYFNFISDYVKYKPLPFLNAEKACVFMGRFSDIFFIISENKKLKRDFSIEVDCILASFGFYV